VTFLILVFACTNLCLGFALGMMFGFGPAPPAAIEHLLPWLEEMSENDDSSDDEDELDFFADEVEEKEASQPS